MTHMRAIFSEHEDLFDQFCSFLPEQEQSACPEPSTVYCSSALDFVSFVKARCMSARPEMYHGFLALLTEVDRGQLSVPEVRNKLRLHQYAYRIHKMLKSRLQMHAKTCALFQEDSELLNEFECFFRGEWASDEFSVSCPYWMVRKDREPD
jgi:hypothetical protein